MPIIRLLCATALLAICTSAVAQSAAPRVQFLTSHGSFVIELDGAAAPQTVANFLRYVDNRFYDDTVFHRVIKGFMVQGGGFTPAFEKKQTAKPIANEANNGLLNVRGSIAMARTQDPHSATAQFFINTVDNDFLNHRNETLRGWGYAVFGRVVSGMDTIDKISSVATGQRGRYSDVPQEDVIIKRAVKVSGE